MLYIPTPLAAAESGMQRHTRGSADGGRRRFPLPCRRYRRRSSDGLLILLCRRDQCDAVGDHDELSLGCSRQRASALDLLRLACPLSGNGNCN